MFNFLKFLTRRLIFMLVTLFLITALLYGVYMALMPPEVRAYAYVSNWQGRGNLENMIETVIEEHGFRDPFLVQYARWVSNLLQGDWGTSTTLNADVLEILLHGTPATAELLLLSVLLFVPLGFISGVMAGWRRGQTPDLVFRLIAFIGTSIPPFVLGLILLALFYVGLYWFPAGRLSSSVSVIVNSSEFTNYTRLVTIDGILNGRLDITLDSLRHLFLPAFTLSLTYWATLGRITRASMIEELHEDYTNTARSKGLQMRIVVWGHVFRNTMVPGLNSIALSAAMFLTNAMIIEIVFGYPGVSKSLSHAVSARWPDVDLAMGFAVYSILLVLPLMLALDIAQALVDPRIREGITEL